jgi:hypothetical protein
MKNGYLFASFRFEAKKFVKQNRRTLEECPMEIQDPVKILQCSPLFIRRRTYNIVRQNSFLEYLAIYWDPWSLHFYTNAVTTE